MAFKAIISAEVNARIRIQLPIKFDRLVCRIPMSDMQWKREKQRAGAASSAEQLVDYQTTFRLRVIHPRPARPAPNKVHVAGSGTSKTSFVS